MDSLKAAAMATTAPVDRNVLPATKSWFFWISLAAVWIFGIAVRFHRLGQRSLWLDEIVSVKDSRTVGAALKKGFHPPVYFLLLHGWMLCFGSSVLALRSFSAVVGSLALLVISAIARALFPQHRSVVVMATFWLSILPVHVWASREVRMYGLWGLFFLIAVWGAVTLKRAGNPRLSRRAIALYLFGLIGGQLTHHYMVFYAMALAIMVWVLLGENPFRKNWREVRQWLLIHSLPFGSALAAALALAIRRRFNVQKFYKWIVGHGGVGKSRLSWTNLARLLWFRNVGRERPEPQAIWKALALLVVVLGSSAVAARDRKIERRKLVAMLIGFFLPYFLISCLPIRGYPRLFIPIGQLVPLYLGYLTAAPFFKPIPLRALVGSPATAFFLMALWPKNAVLFRDNAEPWEKVCNYIEKHEGPNDAILVTARYVTPCFTFCYKGNTPVLPFRTAQYVQKQARGRDQVWLIYSHAWKPHNSDDERKAARWMSKRYQLVKHWRASRYLDVYQYVTPSETYPMYNRPPTCIARKKDS